jgi:hypothetical protein
MLYKCTRANPKQRKTTPTNAPTHNSSTHAILSPHLPLHHHSSYAITPLTPSLLLRHHSSYAIAASNNLTCCPGCVFSTLFFATFFIMKFASISTSSLNSPFLTLHFPEIVSTPTGGLALTRESTPSGTFVRVSLYVVWRKEG